MASGAGVQRRWPDTLVLAAIGVGLLFWTRYLWTSDHGFWAAVVAWFGVCMFVMAVIGPASGPCPLCGKMLHGLFAMRLGGPTRCDHCQLYFIEDEEQKPLPEDYVSQTPMFPVLLNPDKPGLCCVCGTKATQVREFYHKSEGRVSHASPLVQKLEVRAPMPYCSDHKDGVEFGSHDFKPSKPFLESFGPETGAPGELVLKVRSYRFYRAAWGIN